jgi:hypothetical protein
VVFLERIFENGNSFPINFTTNGSGVNADAPAYLTRFRLLRTTFTSRSDKNIG